MAQQVNAPATDPGYLSFISQDPHGKETNSFRLSSDLHTHHHTQINVGRYGGNLEIHSNASLSLLPDNKHPVPVCIMLPGTGSHDPSSSGWESCTVDFQSCSSHTGPVRGDAVRKDG